MKFIAVDWGSSSFRACLINNSGQIVDQVENRQGVLTCDNRDFAAHLTKACDSWFSRWPQLPVVMAGMIGSRSGWMETPYVTCPAELDSLAGQLHHLGEIGGHNIYIVPGLSGCSPNGSMDVMRGEEVQIVGALNLADVSDALVCLPGTHSKWACIEASSLQHFSTFFTGELFALLREHSSIGAILDGSDLDQQDFLAGVECSRRDGGLLHHIFSTRAQMLTNSWNGNSLDAYLSGIVIGSEFAGASELYPPVRTLLVIGNQKLQRLYSLAASEFGYRTQTIDALQASVSGIQRVLEPHLAQSKEAPC